MIRWEKEQIYKILSACPLAFIKCINELVSEVRDYSITDLVSYQIYGKISSPDGEMLVLVLQNMIFMIVFQIMFADYISKHFRYSCVYVFTRLQNRKKWYVCRIAELAVAAVFYLALYIGTITLICTGKSTYPLTGADIKALVLLMISAFFLVWNATVLVNTISLRWGMMAGFFFVQAGLAVLYALSKVSMAYPSLTMINPIACINILNADGGAILQMLIGNLGWTMLICYCSMRYIEKYDIALMDAELN